MKENLRSIFSNRSKGSAIVYSNMMATVAAATTHTRAHKLRTQFSEKNSCCAVAIDVLAIFFIETFLLLKHTGDVAVILLRRCR